jgi:hypothetical protein
VKFEQTNAEHLNLVKAASQDLTTITVQLNQDIKRIHTLPKVQKLLEGTLKQLT